MTNKINRTVASTATSTAKAPKGKTVKDVSHVEMFAKVPAPDGNAELAAPKAPKAIKAPKAAAPVADSALEIRINALASMIRGLNDTCESLVTENAALRAEVSALVEKLNAASTVAAPDTAAPDTRVFAALASAENPFEDAAKAAIANYHAGYVNEKVLDAATRMGKGITARCYLRTNENRTLKAYIKACGLSLAEADAALDAMVFDA